MEQCQREPRMSRPPGFRETEQDQLDRQEELEGRDKHEY